MLVPPRGVPVTIIVTKHHVYENDENATGICYPVCSLSQDTGHDPSGTVREVLEQRLRKSDQDKVEYSTMQSARLSNGHRFYRLKMREEFVVLDLGANGEFVKGNIYSMNGKIALINRRATFNGVFKRSTLERGEPVTYSGKTTQIDPLIPA